MTHQGFANNGISWSADGESLVYSASREAAVAFNLWRVSVSGTKQPEKLDAAGAGATAPAMSADGTRLAFTRGRLDYDLVKWRPGEEISPFVSSTMIENQPRYSPDGSRIVFSSGRSGEGSAIWICGEDGSNLVQLTNQFGRFQGSPYWSPDGRFVVFDAQGKDGRWDIYRVPSYGGKEQRLTAGPGDNMSPSYSRDGRWIYFASTRSGSPEMWRMPSGGGDPLQMTSKGGYYAVESWDGKTLYYNDAGGGVSSLTPVVARSLTDGAEKRILDEVYARRFVPVENGIYYFGRASPRGGFPLLFLDFAARRSRLLTRFEGVPGLGLTVAPDRKTFILPVFRPLGQDLMMIDNFKWVESANQSPSGLMDRSRLRPQAVPWSRHHPPPSAVD